MQGAYKLLKDFDEESESVGSILKRWSSNYFQKTVKNYKDVDKESERVCSSNNPISLCLKTN